MDAERCVWGGSISFTSRSVYSVPSCYRSAKLSYDSRQCLGKLILPGELTFPLNEKTLSRLLFCRIESTDSQVPAPLFFLSPCEFQSLDSRKKALCCRGASLL